MGMDENPKGQTKSAQSPNKSSKSVSLFPQHHCTGYDEITEAKGQPIANHVTARKDHLSHNPLAQVVSTQQEFDKKDLEEVKDVDTHALLNALTISRDETEASNFQKERLLAIEAGTFTELPPAPATKNHALQDYQMQLMLLEHQNKGRLLMTRQEQALVSGPQPGASRSQPTLQPTPITIPPNLQFTPSEPSEILKMDPKRSNVPPFGQQAPSVYSASPSSSRIPVDMLAEARSQADESGLIRQLLSRIEFLENEKKGPTRLPGQGGPCYQILHVLDDDARTVCLQEPGWTFDLDSQLQLKAELPLIDIDTYLRRNDNLLFLVYREYVTPSASKTDLAEILETGVMPPPEPSNEYIFIRSEEVRVAFELFVQSTRSTEEENSHPPENPINAPYLFWYRNRSDNRGLSQLHPKHREHLRSLIDYIEANYAAKYDEFDRMIARGCISHAFIEYMFRRGDIVVSKDRGKTRAYQLIDVPALGKAIGRRHHSQAFDILLRQKAKAAQSSEPDKAWRWDVNCWSIRYNGRFFRENSKLTLELNAEGHSTEVNLSELNVIPLQFAGAEVLQQLTRRGCTFWACRVKKLVSYKGDEENTLHTEGERYMIDNKSYKKLHLETKRNQDFPWIGSKDADATALFSDLMARDEPPPPPSIYLFPPTITGFSLRRKRWTDLEVDKITDVSWNKDAFRRLVADEKTKELVQALVADRISGERNTDLIQGKGNGLIILLHGGPGTGKTFTAESVAEMAEKPLYPVTCGDIGTEPELVEKYLESVLYLGNIWDCVVLLDEADVFLEERGIADLARNALVSVFLRVLEYYDGILILTSNRVGTFDEAFKSRISLALHYPNFTKVQRCRIWENFLFRLKELKEPNINFDDIESNVVELAEEELNGRQIRNAITIGRQLAKFQKKDLSYSHLKHVVGVSGQFETYVKKTKEDLTDEQVARLSGRRW